MNNNNNEKSGAAAVAKSKVEVVEEKFDNTKAMISDNLSTAAEQVHKGSDSMKEFLSEKTESAEDFVREKAYEAGELTQKTLEKANKAGHRAADLLENSSDYIRTFDVVEAKNSAIRTVKQNPEIGIAAAGIFGLLLGWFIGRRSR